MSNAKQNKVVWIVIALAAAGAVLLAMTMLGAPKADTGLQLNDVFKQTPTSAATTQVASDVAPQEKPSVATDPVTSPAIVTDSSAGPGQSEGFAIQVYSFQDQKRAHAALANLQSSGYVAYIVISDLGEKGTWYRVRVGGIADEAQAQVKLEELRKLYKSGFIVKPKQ